jgi:hypothetical protein
MSQNQMSKKQKGPWGGGLHSHNNSRLYVNGRHCRCRCRSRSRSRWLASQQL